jgi:hypothetical protein
MQIKSLVETEDGAAEIQANLSEEQVKFLVEVGLNVVRAKGAQPFLAKTEVDVHQLVQGTGAVN